MKRGSWRKSLVLKVSTPFCPYPEKRRGPPHPFGWVVAHPVVGVEYEVGKEYYP
jgi:hypothetical protein